MSRSAELPTVSAVIPAYNAAATIERALDSVYAQTYPNIIEVIVVDDGSTDATADIVRERYPGVILVQQPNGGRAAARNAGVIAATGELISFLDADDEYLPTKIERQCHVLRRHPGIDILLCRGHLLEADRSDIPFKDSDARRATAAGMRYLTFHDLFQELTPAIGIGNTGWLIRRELYLELGGQRSEFVRLQDVEFLLRAAGLGYTVAVMPEVLAVYHRSSSRLATCNPPYARAAAAILREYDPDGTNWQADLLDPRTFSTRLCRQLIASAAILGAAGAREEAMALLQESSDGLKCGLLLSTRWLLARHLPWFYVRLSTIRR